MMSWRPIRPADLEESLHLNLRGMGHEFVSRNRALAVWRWLLKARSFQGVVIESDEPIMGHRIVGFAASVFVAAAFAENEIADPKPGLNARLISSIASGKAVVLSAKQLGYENAQARLNNIVLQPSSMLDVLTPEQGLEVLRQASLATLSCHDGYQVRRVMMEMTSAAEISYSKFFPNWKIKSTFEDFHRDNPGNPWNRDRALMAIDFTEGLSFVVKGGHRREPVLGLRISDQELLAGALKGLTDVELSEELGLKLSTLKKRWASVFNRVQMSKPDLLPDFADKLEHQGRGRQKKHRLLAYVREHPEELRPFHRPQISQKRRSDPGGPFKSRVE